MSIALLVTWQPAAAEDDPFAAMDKLLDQQFETVDLTLDEQYERVDQAMEAAYQRLGAEVGAVWGEDQVLLPSKTAWVDYSDDLSSRRIIDFEAGTVSVEQLIRPTDSPQQIIKQMTQAAIAASMDSEAALADKDQALKYARQTLAEQGITIDEAPVQSTEPVLANVAEPVDVAQLDKLIGQALEAAQQAPVKAQPGSITPPAQAPEPEQESEAPEQPALKSSPSSIVREPVASIAKAVGDTQRVIVRIPLKPGFTGTLADRYVEVINREALRQKLPPSLLLAIMETESHFNPRAKSAVPAYGLMQLVPRSGAMDAYEYVYGSQKLLEPEYLYHAENNVELGSAYLNVLNSRYLRHITDEHSRQLCVIAAYNTGAGNVSKAFTGKLSPREAAKVINTLTPDEVYEHLRTNLPYEETRRYIVKVTKAQKKYLSLDTSARQGAKL